MKMIPHTGISHLIDVREKQLLKINALLSRAESISKSLHPYASKRITPKAGADSSEGFDIKRMQKVIQDNIGISSDLNRIQNKISNVDDAAKSIRKLPASVSDLQILLKENEIKAHSLNDKHKEHRDKYYDIDGQQKQVSKDLDVLRKERDAIIIALETQAANKRQAEKDKAEKAILRKVQIKRARWFLFASVLGVIAYRVSVIGGVS